MSTEMYLSTLTLFFGSIVLIIGMRYHASVQQARARLANDEAYRELAARAADAQADSAAALTSVNKTLAEMHARLRAVEHMLKAVE